MSRPCRSSRRPGELTVIGPRPRYLLKKCCGDPDHITNFEDSNYAEMMGTGTRVGKELRNLLHARRIKCKKSLNPALLVGLTGSDRADPAKMVKIWGKGPVHPAEPAYNGMAKNHGRAWLQGGRGRGSGHRRPY